MSRLFLFADESGDFCFTTGDNISKFYIVCTVVMESCEIGDSLLALRRSLSWDNKPLNDFFHATCDKQVIRDAVYAEISKFDFSIQATIMEKRKAQPQTRVTEERFYKYGWYYHFMHSSGGYLDANDEIHVTVATIGTKKKRTAFEDAVRDVIRQKLYRHQWETSFWPCQTDPCLQVADYCTWAIQRKWEMGDTRSYDLIKDKINYEYELFKRGTQLFY
ncbi:DUF3800 domain-containing protein [Desulfovibrio sp. Huiquan2017]|uniref:DUF3800 domain-containing protein n=1 Tax=Desulfovibrio sp. Huiquan2017 TaxID=2816861 RepID=UPI001A9397BA|nr:DUF3800 domain-containing protein [Desulfovibrio sp. Huiquan2017]